MQHAGQSQSYVVRAIDSHAVPHAATRWHPRAPAHVSLIHPPLCLQELLSFHDLPLLQHLKSFRGGYTSLAWGLLSNLMTDVLTRTDWLKVGGEGWGFKASGVATPAWPGACSSTS